MRERVQKILARAGIASRRKCEELIAAGRITVNGTKIKLGDQADIETDDIRFDGERIKRKEILRYYILNKPKGYVSTVNDPEGRPTLMQLIPRGARVYPVGRLDLDAEGLIIMTNDGALANKLMHPRYEVIKKYHVTLTTAIKSEDFHQLKSKGVKIDRRRVIPDQAILHTPQHVEVAIHEGRKHIVKRMFRKLGYTVAKLKRTQYANISLKGLPSGASRDLTREELRGLQRFAQERK